MDVKEAKDIDDIIEEKYNDWLYSTNEGIGLTIEEAKHILRNDPDFHYCDSLLYEAYNVVLSELEKKEGLINVMQEEFERLEGIEDNTIMLKYELEKKHAIIDEMSKYVNSPFRIPEEKYCEFYNSDEDCCWKTDKECKDCIKDYFTKKCEGK